MSRQVYLADDDRKRLAELLAVVGTTQRQLALDADVKQPWLSHVLNGHRSTVDADMMQRVADQLASALKNGHAGLRLSDERIAASLTYLARFSVIVPSKTYRPGGRVPRDAEHYIKRDADDGVHEALRRLPFFMLVRGPVQSGQSSLLGVLEAKARELGIETARFDAGAGTTIAERVRRNSDIDDTNEAVCLALSELLQAEWRLESPRYGPLYSITRLNQWLNRALDSVPLKPRLLILDDLASLGARAADEWLSTFVRKYWNDQGSQLSIAVGLSHNFGPSFIRRQNRISTIVNWSVRASVEWFDRSQVEDLERRLSGSTSSEALPWTLFKGQPYLTHTAIVDDDFRKVVQLWTELSPEHPVKNTADSIRRAGDAIRRTRPYKQHLNAIRSDIFGPALVANNSAKRIVESFIAAVIGGLPVSDPDHMEFLHEARLTQCSCEPGTSKHSDLGPKGPVPLIYRLIAQDLGRDIGRRDI